MMGPTLYSGATGRRDTVLGGVRRYRSACGGPSDARCRMARHGTPENGECGASDAVNAPGGRRSNANGIDRFRDRTFVASDDSRRA